MLNRNLLLNAVTRAAILSLDAIDAGFAVVMQIVDEIAAPLLRPDASSARRPRNAR